MPELLRNKQLLLLLALTGAFIVAILFFLYQSNRQENNLATPLEQAQDVRDIVSDPVRQAISPVKQKSTGNKYVTLTGKLLGIQKEGEDNVFQLEFDSLPETPQVSVVLGPDSLMKSYVKTEIVNPENPELAEKIETHSLMSNREIVASLRPLVGKEIMIDVLTETPITESSPDCNAQCQEFLDIFEEHKESNIILMEQDIVNTLDGRTFGAVMEVWEPYE